MAHPAKPFTIMVRGFSHVKDGVKMTQANCTNVVGQPNSAGNSRQSPRAPRWVQFSLSVLTVGAVIFTAACEDPASLSPVSSSTASLSPQSSPTPDSSSSHVTAPNSAIADFDDVAQAVAALEKLPVKGRAPKTGYDRDSFAYRSYDADHNGCDVRNDVLRRDLTQVEFKARTGNCIVESGILADPYSGKTISFLRGEKTSALIQIDHVVALSDAWQKGAQSWDEETLKQFGNDPENLLAVDGALNSEKGDADAATWLPPNRSFRCEYVARQIQVKTSYGLWVTKAERDAMTKTLAAC